MYLDHKEITLIHAGHGDSVKKIKAYLAGFKKDMNIQNIHDGMVSTSLLEYMLYYMPEEVEEIVDKQDEFYKRTLKFRKFPIRDWASILKKNPQLLKYPLIGYNGRVLVCYGPEDAKHIFKIGTGGLAA